MEVGDKDAFGGRDHAANVMFVFLVCLYFSFVCFSLLFVFLFCLYFSLFIFNVCIFLVFVFLVVLFILFLFFLLCLVFLFPWCMQPYKHCNGQQSISNRPTTQLME